MAKALPKLVPIARLVQNAAEHPVGNAGTGHHVSYPMPTPGQKGLYVAFIHFEVMPSHDTANLIPAYLSTWDVETARFQELRIIGPGDVGLAQASVPCRVNDPERQTPEFLSSKKRLFHRYDELLGPFGASLSPVPSETRLAAQDFRSLFPALVERELLSCYQTVGGRFLAWLGQAGR